MKFRLPLHTAVFLKADGESLSKRKIKWGIPLDLSLLAKKNKKTFIGVGKWRNTNVEFLCIASNNDNVYLDKKLLKKLIK